MKMIGVIFSNIFDLELGDLTRHRTLASLPFGARYRLIDFILSNMSNSHIDHIAVITKYNYQSLMDHLGSCEEWDLNRKNGRVVIIPPFSNADYPIYQGKLQALQGALSFLHKAKGDYVLISSSNVICNIDFEKALKSHINSNYKVTAICCKPQKHFNFKKHNLVFSKAQNTASDVMINHSYTEDNLLSMGMYIVDKSFLINVILECVSHGFFDFEKDFLQNYFLNHNLKINLYNFDNTVLFVNDIVSYFNSNQLLLNHEIKDNIFNKNNPIYTKVKDEVPSFYHNDCKVKDSLIADGCKVLGTVENSILFRGVTIKKGAIIKNSIIMQDSTVNENVNLDYSIIDKDCTITENQMLIGNKLSPIIIEKGQII